MKTFTTYLQYLKLRFQIVPLSLLVLSDVLVIARITDGDNLAMLVLPAVFFMVILYLFNNRVGDDHRDFAFDNEHYPERAIQQGEISLAQLRRLAYFSGFAMLLMAAVLGFWSLILFLPVWLFAFWARHDFSLPPSFKEQYFFVYNFLNMTQMLVLQAYVYISLIDSLHLSPLILVHIAFVFVLSLQVEVTRKIKVNISPANDLYSDRMGMGKALLLWYALGLLGLLFFGMLATMMEVGRVLIYLGIAAALLVLLAGALPYYLKRDPGYEKWFWAAMIGSYVGLNLVLAYG